MRQVVPVRAVLTVLLLLATFLGFQNCSQSVNHDAQQNASKGTVTDPSQENGTGYGGKPYIRRLIDGACDDGSNVQARLVTTSDTTATLTRENCQDVPARSVKVDRAFIGGDKAVSYDVLLVNGLLFDDAVKPVTAEFCYLDTATRSTRFIVQNLNGGLFGFLKSVQPVAKGADYSLDYGVDMSTESTQVIYRNQMPIAPNNYDASVTVEGPTGAGSLDLTSSTGNSLLSLNGLSCYSHATSTAPEATIPQQADVTPSPTPAPAPMPSPTSQPGENCTNSTLAEKPSNAQFMSLTGADFATAASILSGVIGSNFDSRNWHNIMASGDILAAARSATALMYNDGYCRSASATKAPYSSGGYTVSVLSTSGNLQLQKQMPGPQYWIRLIDGDGYELTTVSNCASLPNKVINYGFEWNSSLISMRTEIMGGSDAGAKSWMLSCPP